MKKGKTQITGLGKALNEGFPEGGDVAPHLHLESDEYDIGLPRGRRSSNTRPASQEVITQPGSDTHPDPNANLPSPFTSPIPATGSNPAEAKTATGGESKMGRTLLYAVGATLAIVLGTAVIVSAISGTNNQPGAASGRPASGQQATAIVGPTPSPSPEHAEVKEINGMHTIGLSCPVTNKRLHLAEDTTGISLNSRNYPCSPGENLQDAVFLAITKGGFLSVGLPSLDGDGLDCMSWLGEDRPHTQRRKITGKNPDPEMVYRTCGILGAVYRFPDQPQGLVIPKPNLN